MACLTPPYFLYYLLSGTIFKKALLNIICGFTFSLQIASEMFLILRTIQRTIITNIHRALRKVPIILVKFQ